MKKIIFISCIFLGLEVNQTYAIPPPDFIIQVTSQLGIYFAMGVALFSTIFGTTFIYLKEFYKKNKLPVFFLMIALLTSGLFLYDHLSYEEKKTNMIKALELKNSNINKWLSYKNQDISDLYKDLTYNEKVEQLLELESIELEKWLFDNKENNIIGKNISNKDFENIILSKNSKYVLLDAREDIEYQIGNIPGSIHHRVADLKTEEKWKALSKDKTYIVICWGGMRGKLVSEFLLTKGIKTMYLEGGVKNWVKFGGIFNGKTELKDVFKDSNYNKYLDEEEFLENMFSGTKIIDAREITRLTSNDTLQYSDNISIMYNTSIFLEEKFNKYNKEDKIIVICNDYINCFDAQLVGLELEKLGAELLGIYFKEGVV